MNMKLFFSHSSSDAALVEKIVALVRSALPVTADEIRCTSVEGHKLPGGAKTDETLRREVHKSEAFIGVISPRSLESMYVTFELGARWGADKHLLPLLAPDVSPKALSGPLSGINALRCDERGDLLQLVEDLANELSLEVEKTTAYLKHIDSVLHHSGGSQTVNKGNDFPNVFDLSDGQVVVIAELPGTSDKQKTINLTYLYLLGKELLTGGSKASFDEIRQACRRHACYNSNNFASYVKSAKIVSYGSGQSLSAGLTHPARKQARQLAEDLNRG